MNNTLVSVIIPAYNSEKGLLNTLNALIEQKGIKKEDYEIIVVDNNSTDNTLENAMKMQAEYSNLVKVYEQPIQGSYAARNKGIEFATGKVICFIDSDMIPEQEYLSKVLDHFDDPELFYGGTKLHPIKSKNTMVADYDYTVGLHVDKSLKHGHYVGTGILCVRKEIFKKVGTFDHRLESGGDVEFGKRVYEAGLKQKFLSNVSIAHPTRNAFSSLLNKSKRVARGNAQLYFYYPKRFNYKKTEFLSLKYFLPNNPKLLKDLADKRGADLSFTYCFFLSFIAVPLRFAGYISFKRKLKELQQ